MKQIFIDVILDIDKCSDADDMVFYVLKKLPDDAFDEILQIRSNTDELGADWATREFQKLCRKYLSDDEKLMKLIDNDEAEYPYEVSVSESFNGHKKTECVDMCILSETRCKGLRTLAEFLIKADKKIVIDISTTGSDVKRDEILKLSIIDTDNNVLYDGYFYPQKDYHQDFNQICDKTGITPEQLRRSPKLDGNIYLIDRILLSANTIVGYSLGKVIAFLRQSGCVWRTDYDFVSIADAFCDVIKKRAALDECAAYFGYELKDTAPHNTLEKCRAILHCYNKMLEEGWDITE